MTKYWVDSLIKDFFFTGTKGVKALKKLEIHNVTI